MKKSGFFLAILAMVVTAIVSIAVVSCKKENQDASLNNPQLAKTFTAPQIDDMNAYLKDFKQRMQTSKDGETLTLEEAAWHLSSLANYDFANVTDEYASIRFDTLYINVTLTDGAVFIGDLNAGYTLLSNAIAHYLQSIDFENANIRYIDVAISETGSVTAILSVTFEWEHTWYYEDVFDARYHCYEYFSCDSVYRASGLGRSELERILNLIESHSILSVGQNHGRVYYTQSREIDYLYSENIDPYGSPSFLNSRLLASTIAEDPIIDLENMCYYLDSYLGLGYDGKLDTEVVAKWIVEYGLGHHPSTQLWVGHHTLTVIYAIPHVIGPENPGGAE